LTVTRDTAHQRQIHSRKLAIELIHRGPVLRRRTRKRTALDLLCGSVQMHGQAHHCAPARRESEPG